MDNYQKNKLIKEEAKLYFACCNRILDRLYDEKDSIPKDTNVILDYESIRKKINLGAPLDESEITLLILGMKFISDTMLQEVNGLNSAIKEINDRIKSLT